MVATKIVINGEEVEIGGSSAVPQGVNLLDNAHFIPIYDDESNMILPINQRGITGVFSTAGSYFIDRWVLISGSVEITDEGLKLNGTIEQRFEYAFGDNMTATALSTTGFVSAEYDDEGKRFQITANGETIIAAKLELGDQQTLAHQDEGGNWVLNDPPPNHALELAKCQRYYVRYSNQVSSTFPLNGQGYRSGASSSYLLFPFTLPGCMRAIPTVKASNVFVAAYSNNSGEVDIDDAKFGVEIIGNICLININKSGIAPLYEPHRMVIRNGGWLEFDANL